MDPERDPEPEPDEPEPEEPDPEDPEPDPDDPEPEEPEPELDPEPESVVDDGVGSEDGLSTGEPDSGAESVPGAGLSRVGASRLTSGSERTVPPWSEVGTKVRPGSLRETGPVRGSDGESGAFRSC